ncbi:hypothetical protein GS538_09275 [Rhodococcus hoagii]|nr:hypothetical protein [Prescottella equi]
MSAPRIERGPRRQLSPDEIEREIAGIRVGLELGGLEMTDIAEEGSRAVLTGEMTADEAVARAIAKIRARAEQ